MFCVYLNPHKMYDNLEAKRKKIATQKKVGYQIIKKRGGRPKAPEKKKYHIKMPILLHEEVKREGKPIGLNVSSFICVAVKEKLDKMKLNVN